VRMFRSEVVGIILAALAIAPQAGAQQSNRWAPAKCDLKPAHFLVNSGLLYLKSATETKFEDQKQKDLRDANRVLTQALTTAGQEKNPAAWYYLARYYIMTQDLTGADSAFRRAEALKPDCADDITAWRRFVWVPTLNAGIAAWQANNTDSAIVAFRQANAILQTEPQGFKYLASLLYNAGQLDSAAFYFRRSADIAARDPKFHQDLRDALFNLARIHHSQRRWAEAEATYREYLTVVPNDPEVLASLGAVLTQTGQRDSAFALYRRIIAQGDSVGSLPLFRAGVAIFQGVAPEPDTAARGGSCRTEARTNRQLTSARIRARCDSVTTRMMREYDAAANGTYRLAAQAFEAGVRLNPYYRDGLFNLVNTYLQVNDTAAMLPVAQRLVAVDPMNRTSLRLLAFAHQRAGHIDSTLYYLRMADSTLTSDVTVSEFDAQDQSAEVKGIVTNLRAAPSQPFKLVFEFLNTKGEVVATQSADVPAIPPEGVAPFDVKVIGAGIQAWRYHKE
jgi:tetratricopeptide (TPR) repeat protein